MKPNICYVKMPDLHNSISHHSQKLAEITLQHHCSTSFHTYFPDSSGSTLESFTLCCYLQDCQTPDSAKFGVTITCRLQSWSWILIFKTLWLTLCLKPVALQEETHASGLTFTSKNRNPVAHSLKSGRIKETSS